MTALPCPPELYPALSRLLDAVLDLPPQVRGAWVAELGEEHAAVLPYLRQVLGGLPTDDAGDGSLTTGLAGAAAGGWDDSDLAAEPTYGDRVGPYTLESELGRGGMGVVWLAARSDGAYARQVALKLPHVHLLAGTSRGRFRRERDILAALTHPHIAQFLDAGVTATGQPYLALELVTGRPITDACRTAGTSLAGRRELIRQVIAALHHAHTHLIVHRDIKPSNVLVDGQGQVKLLDFGIAKLLEGPDSGDLATQLTRLGGRVATPDYAAPEQLAGGTVTMATDVYAVGVLLFELLTGRRPFASAFGPQAWLNPAVAARAEPPLASSSIVPEHARTVGGLSPRELARALAGDLDAILAKALSYDPAERYETMAELASDLERSGRLEPIGARRLGRLARAGRFVRRHRLGVGLGGGLLLAVGLGIGGVLWQARATAREARRATAIKDFLVSVFKESDPRVAHRKPRGELTARELLDLAAGRIDRELADDPATRIELLGLTATIYTYLDELDPARRLARLQVTAAEGYLPAADPVLLDARFFEVWIALQAGDVAAASERLAELDARLTAAGLDLSRHRAEWLLASGDIAAAAGDLAAQERLLTRAALIYQQAAPKDSGYAATLANLGRLAFARDDLAAALDWFDRALAAALRADQDVGTDLARIQAQRGRVLTALGRYPEAEGALVDARRRFAVTLGSDHATAWQATAGLGYLRCLTGDSVAAEALFASLPVPTAREDLGNQRRRAEAELLHGLCLAATGQRPAAVELLTRARDVLRDQGDAAGDVRRAERALAGSPVEPASSPGSRSGATRSPATRSAGR
jgi:serine/threonine-protein kinase